ncbi:hypothetical protein, partial [Klebsiella pneumoniae]|uniref:hypothetical protein n=1 Tax=Klebsiella pneumoniae TaxID=573 RepID=UPI0034D225DE
MKCLATLPVGKAGALGRYAATMRSQSDDPGRDVLSVGPDGMRLMAAIHGTTPMDLYCKLIEWGATPVGDDTL